MSSKQQKNQENARKHKKVNQPKKPSPMLTEHEARMLVQRGKISWSEYWKLTLR